MPSRRLRRRLTICPVCRILRPKSRTVVNPDGRRPGRGEDLARLVAVPVHLRHERLDRLELLLAAQPLDEPDPHVLVVEIA